MNSSREAIRLRFPAGAVIPFALIASWEIAFRLSGYDGDTLAAPSAIVVALVSGLLNGSILAATADTLAVAFAGLALGGLLGLVVGLLLGTFPFLNRLLEVTIEALRPIPPVALIPLGILIFGFGYGLGIMCVAWSCAWTVLILTRSAIGGIEPRLVEVAKALRLGFFSTMGKVIFPAVLPQIVIAFRLAAGIALIVAVTVEIAANPLGVGYEMMVAEQSFRPELMLAYLVWIGLIGWLLNQVLITMQNRFLGAAGTAGVRHEQ